MPHLVDVAAGLAERLVHAHRLHAVPVAHLPAQVVAGHELAEAGMERAHVVVLEIDLDERLPVERVLDGLDLVQQVALEVELLRHAELREVARHVALAVEEHAVPLRERLPRQVQARVVGELRGSEVLALGAVAPAVQRAGDGAAGELAVVLEDDRLAMAADVGDQVVAPAIVHERPGAVGAPVEHAVVAGLGRHLRVPDVSGPALEEEFALGFSDLRVEVPRQGQMQRRAREVALTREIRHYPHLQNR